MSRMSLTCMVVAALTLSACSTSQGPRYETTSSLPSRPVAPMLLEPRRPNGEYSLGAKPASPDPGRYRWNGNPDRIQEGTAPPNLSPPPQPVGGPNGERVIVVRPGDTLYSLARHHGVSVAALAEENRLMTASIQAGQRLVLPAGAR